MPCFELEFNSAVKQVIGVNPPFALVDKFVSHALDMNPRLLVLIVPPMKKK